MNNIKKRFSLFMAVLMLVMSMPVGEILAYAETPQLVPKVTSMEINRNFSNGFSEMDAMIITVRGKNLNSVDGDEVLTVHGVGGTREDVPGKPGNSWSFIIPTDKINVGNITSVEFLGQEVNIRKLLNIKVNSISPVNRILTLNEKDTDKNKVTIEGENFPEKEDITLWSSSGVEEFELSGNKVEREFDYKTTAGGNYTLEFTKETTDNDITAVLKQNYLDLFRVRGKLNISEDVYIIPNQGIKGSKADIIADDLPRDVSVFLLRKGDSNIYEYKSDNLVKVQEYTDGMINGQPKHTQTITIPETIGLGEYDVVITNKLEDGDIKNDDGSYKDDLSQYIDSIFVLNDSYTVIDAKNAARIINVDPPKGPESGLDATIEGQYLGSISDLIFESNDNFKEIKVKDPQGEASSQRFSLEYKGKDEGEPIGKYILVGDGEDVYKIEKTITGVIGPSLGFYKDVEWSKSKDLIKVRIGDPQIEDFEDRFKEVILKIETTYYGQKNKDGVRPVIRTMTEAVEWSKKFEFEQVRFEPEITEVVPDIIPVTVDNKIEDGIELNIFGENFLMHRYKKDGKDYIKYPKINLGGQAVLNPNIESDNLNVEPKEYAIKPENISMFDKNGLPISGTDNNDIATKIRIKLPKGIVVSNNVIDKGAPELELMNPLKNSDPIVENSDVSFTSKVRYPIKFTKPSGNIPRIIEMNPTIVTTEGYEGVVIKGSGFDRDVVVYIDGEEVDNLKWISANELIFNVPAKREGTYQIMVQNKNGAMDKENMTYVETYTDIELIDFNPKKGTEGTIVTITGNGFVRPSDAKIDDVSGWGIYKLIGTRVRLGGEDINDYNKNADGDIELQPYTPSDKLLVANNGKLYVKDYYDSIILENESGDNEYYSIFYDTNVNEYKISDGYQNIYTISANGAKIQGNKLGENFDIEIIDDAIDTLVITSKSGSKTKLKIKTPYQVESKDGEDKIIGNKVRVINGNELIFQVPYKSREGFYDLQVINPDTNSDSKVGEKGFYYSYLPAYNPTIKEIKPAEGAVSGGYYITITAEKGDMFTGFVDGKGSDKTLVTIGGVQVPPEDITIASDGYSLTLKVPKYPEELPKDVSRKDVTVTVVNPDGGSDSRLNGFTYVVSISNPKITNVVRDTGSATGGENVDIVGSDFRLFEPYYDGDEDNYTDLNDNGVRDDLRTGKIYIPEYDKEIKLDDLTDQEWRKYVIPILPKVYFGDQQAEVLEFDDTGRRLVVKTPKGVNGSVKVTVVNNDYGKSNEYVFNYKVTSPKIDAIVPPVGRRKGGDNVEINGQDFIESKIKEVTSPTATKERDLQLVQFGDPMNPRVSNKSFEYGIKDENGFDNSGRIENRKATVIVDNLTIKYDTSNPDNKLLDFSLIERVNNEDVEYKFSFSGYKDDTIYLPIGMLETEEGDRYSERGLVKIQMEAVDGNPILKRLRIDKGFSQNSRLTRAGKIELETPSYYTVGDTKAIVYNPDLQEASKTFEFRNPDSKPYITDIERNGESGEPADGNSKLILKVPYTGGSTMTIHGGDFRRNVDIMIGSILNIPRESIEYYPEGESISNKLVFPMPEVNESYVDRLYRVTVRNPDGASANSNDPGSPEIPIYIQFTKPESIDMRVDKIVPNSGPTKGGTEVTIYGNDFRKTMDGYDGKNLEVTFKRGDKLVKVPASDIISVDFDRIVLKTPPFTAGLTDVIITNPDGNEVSLTGTDGFTYTSAPRINSVVNPENEQEVIENISVKGGERIKLKGNDFLEGAQVIFKPKLKLLEDDEESTGQILVIDGRRYELLSGEEGIDVEVLDGNNILVTTPEGQIGDKGVLVINPDGGVSNVYNLEYGIPEVGAPFDVRADLAYNQYIRISWQRVRNALEYEVYVSEDDGAFEFIGSTTDLTYVYKDLKPDTKYQFMVRAIGQYGESKPLDESKSNYVRTGKTIDKPKDEDGIIGEETEVKREGNDVTVVVGSKDFGMTGLTIDMTQGELAGAKNITMRIPANLVSAQITGDIIVKTIDYNMKLSPTVFKNDLMTKNQANSKAGVVFKVTEYNGPLGAAPGARMMAGPRYKLEAINMVDKAQTDVGSLAQGINLNIKQNNLLVQSRRLKDLGLSRYYAAGNRWIKTATVDRMTIYTTSGSRR